MPINFTEKVHGGWGNGSVPKVHIHKHADLNQGPQHLSKNPGTVATIYNPELEGRDWRISGFTERPE